MYAGAKKCLRQTIGWTAYLDGDWADVDVTFTCAGGNPSAISLLNMITQVMMMMMTLFGRSTNTRDNIGPDHQV